MYICIDFDGTIVDHCFPEIGTEAPKAIYWLKRLQDQGAKLILFTMRSDTSVGGPMLSDAVSFLEDQGIKFYGINKNPDQDSWTESPKAYADIYTSRPDAEARLAGKYSGTYWYYLHFGDAELSQAEETKDNTGST